MNRVIPEERFLNHGESFSRQLYYELTFRVSDEVRDTLFPVRSITILEL